MLNAGLEKEIRSKEELVRNNRDLVDTTNSQKVINKKKITFDLS